MSSFVLKNTTFLPTLNITLETYMHTRTGAMHYHFATDHSENVFMVALRTMPENSTGVAHILEHTALCGSEKFPVRDPFFSMLRRSLQTFMNAFTSSDWTAYPFATENQQDFDNLLQIYLDAVFFPRLDRLDFLQEGHRLEFDEQGNLLTKGVVYNEMKGVYGNAHERIFEIQKSFLQPTTTYHHDSGGTPSHILDLTYEDFLAFHKKHYHPTNATFFTFGNIPASKHHTRFEELALSRFSGYGEHVEASDEKRYITPLSVMTGYPSTDQENPNQVHILISWLLGATYRAEERLEVELISRLLMDHSASPLRYALENAEWSASPSPLSFLDDSSREMRFSAGVITNSPEYTQKTETLILDVMRGIATEGMPTRDVHAVIDQIEISLREQSSGYPYGLSLFLAAIPAATHGGDIASLLDPTEILDNLRIKTSDPKYIADLVQRLFLSNPHRLTLTMTPDIHAGNIEEQIEKSYHAQLQIRLSDEEKQEIHKSTEALKARQNQTVDDGLLPRLSSSDIPLNVRPLRASPNHQGTLTHYSGPTNRLAYRELFFPVSVDTKEEYADMSIVSGLLTELGTKKYSYLDLQKQITRETGGMDAAMISASVYGTDMSRTFLRFNVRALESRITQAETLLLHTINETHFDEVTQIRNILSERLLSMKSAFTTQGHHTAMMRASSGQTFQAGLSEMVDGIESMYQLKRFLEKSDADIVSFSSHIYQKLITHTPLECHIDSKDDTTPIWTGSSIEGNGQRIYTHTPRVVQEAWIADINVSYVALSIPVVRSDHRDAHALTILAQFLRDGYLHTAIREKGGAYGSGARYNAQAEAFEFFSYRDPRIVETFDAFEASIQWFLETHHDPKKLEEAKLGVFAGLDRPASIAHESKADYERSLFGHTDAIRNIRRAALLSVSIDDLKEVANKYLTHPTNASRVVITGESGRESVQGLGLEIHDLV